MVQCGGKLDSSIEPYELRDRPCFDTADLAFLLHLSRLMTQVSVGSWGVEGLGCWREWWRGLG